MAVTHYGSTCGYIIESFGLARDCLAVDPYTGVMMYDFVSTPMSTAIANGQVNSDGSFSLPVCNDLPSSIVSYAFIPGYLYGFYCIYDSFLWISFALLILL